MESRWITEQTHCCQWSKSGFTLHIQLPGKDHHHRSQTNVQVHRNIRHCHAGMWKTFVPAQHLMIEIPPFLDHIQQIHNHVEVSVTIFLLSHLHMSSSHQTVASPLPHFIISIDSAVCFTIMLFTYTCLPFVFWCMYFIHATYMFFFYLSITCHASMAYSYINLSVDLAVSLASL